MYQLQFFSRVVFRPTQFTPSPQLQCTQYHEISPEWQCSLLVLRGVLKIFYIFAIERININIEPISTSCISFSKVRHFPGQNASCHTYISYNPVGEWFAAYRPRSKDGGVLIWKGCCREGVCQDRRH